MSLSSADFTIHVIHTPSEEYKTLQKRVDELEQERLRLIGLYTSEADKCMRLLDLLRENNIPWR